MLVTRGMGSPREGSLSMFGMGLFPSGVTVATFAVIREITIGPVMFFENLLGLEADASDG